jgi:hypothetical protein
MTDDLLEFEYLMMPRDRTFITTKGAVEDYVITSMCDYLNGFMDGIWDEFRDDGSEWDKAIEFFQKYVNDAIKELKGEGVRK